GQEKVAKIVQCGDFASKVLVAPKVGFLRQKSFHILIAFADYDLQPQFLSLFRCWPPDRRLLLVNLNKTIVTALTNHWSANIRDARLTTNGKARSPRPQRRA
ncbi:MAG TPA: hypothetical protein VFR80_09080, partial [Pyrinomonadaceae bacterium]|nr:hypothetical protein [Pyrinomonadaceae bacterium]